MLLCKQQCSPSGSQGEALNYTHFSQAGHTLNISQKRGWFKITKRQVGNIRFCPFTGLSLSLSRLSQHHCSLSAKIHNCSSPNPAVRKQQAQLTWHLKESTLQKSLEDENTGTEVISRCCSHNPHLPTELVLKQSQTCLVLSPQVLLQRLL